MRLDHIAGEKVWGGKTSGLEKVQKSSIQTSLWRRFKLERREKLIRIIDWPNAPAPGWKVQERDSNPAIQELPTDGSERRFEKKWGGGERRL